MSSTSFSVPARRQYVSALVPSSAHVLCALIILTSVIDSVTIGYDASLMGSLNVMKPYLTYLAPSNALVSLNSSIIFVGGAVAAPFSSVYINWMGRKWGMGVAACIMVVGGVLQGAAVHIAMFLVGRFMIGFGSGFAAVAAPTYVAETSVPQWRAFALGMYYTCWAAGTLIASGICYGTNKITTNWCWRIPSLVQIIPAALCLIILFFIPESPRWLAYQDRMDECLEVLAVVNGKAADDPAVLLQFQEIKETIEFEKSEGASLGIKELVKSPSNRKRLLLSTSVAPIAMLTGSNIITFYFGDMLTQAGITSSDTQLEINCIMSAWQLVCAVAGSLYAEKIGRKVLAAGSTSAATVFLFILGGLTKVYGTSDNHSGIYGTVACIFLFLGAYSFGLTPLTVMYPPEVLTYSMRGSGMGVFTLLAKSCGVFVAWIFPFLFTAVGWKTYIINACWNVLFVLFIIFYWVETKGLTLEEVDKKFGGVKFDLPDLSDLAKEKIILDEDSKC